MIKKIKSVIKNTVKKPTGERFMFAHESLKPIFPNKTVRILLQPVLGIVLILTGIVLLFIPGPGLLFILIGIIMLCLFSKKMASLLDKFEKWIRARINK